MDVIGRKGTVGKNRKKGFRESSMQPQHTQKKLSCVLITVSFVTPFKRAALNLQCISITLKTDYLGTCIEAPQSLCMLPSLQQCSGCCCSTTLPTAKWKTELKEKHIKPVIFIQQCLLRDTGGLDFITVTFERIKYDN